MPRRLRKVHSLNAASRGEKPPLWRLGNLPQNPLNLAKGSKGNLTKFTDPVGRETLYEYDPNDIDLLRIKQKNPQSPTGYDLLTSYTYRPTDPQHLPATITDASGQTTTYTYRSNGDIETVVTPERDNLTLAERTTTFEYYADDAASGAGRLQRITGPLTEATVSFTYDDLSRLRTVTDSDGYTLVTDYDAMDRPTKTTYPDGTFEETVYNRLDAERHRDRFGRWSHTFYDALRRVSATRDPLGRTVTQVWCTCGSLERLVDGKKNETIWERDIQGRVKKEIRANTSETVYTYENTTSRLKRATDPKGQHKDYEYFLDDNLRQISYPNAENRTPTVSFTYEPTYDRITMMLDGTGETRFGYHPVTVPPRLGATHLATVDGPLSSDTITYTYDELGRMRGRAINGVEATQDYDPLGRVRGETNPLGTFAYTYEDATTRLQSVGYPNGQTATYLYYPNVRDHRLQEIHNRRAGGSTLSKFNYGYDSVGNIRVWTQQVGDSPARVLGLGYDVADQLTDATLTTTDTIPVTLKRNVYTYDDAGNRATEQIDDSVTVSSFDKMNRLATQQPGGVLRFKGVVSEVATVTVQGKAAQVTAENKFEGRAQVTPGTNTVEVSARDYTGNERTNTYEVNVSGSTGTFTYDRNGNLTRDGTRTFEWDAENRLLTVTRGTLRSEFSYDGRSRRVRIVEKDSGIVTIDREFVWCAREICEERDTTGSTVMKRFYERGVQESGQPYFYAFDHLGSVRELTDASAAVRARYDYDTYGKRTLINGDKEADFGFTGHYEHSPSGMTLALYRAYDSSMGRWMSEDPIGFESGDANFYAYVSNNPVAFVDPEGLQCVMMGELPPWLAPWIDVMAQRQLPAWRFAPSQTPEPSITRPPVTPPRPLTPLQPPRWFPEPPSKPPPVPPEAPPTETWPPDLTPRPWQAMKRMPWWMKILRGITSQYDESSGHHGGAYLPPARVTSPAESCAKDPNCT